jgi:hypothetical protein
MKTNKKSNNTKKEGSKRLADPNTLPCTQEATMTPGVREKCFPVFAFWQTLSADLFENWRLRPEPFCHNDHGTGSDLQSKDNKIPTPLKERKLR